VPADGQPEVVDAFDAEREPFDAPAGRARLLERDAERVGRQRVGDRQLPPLPAAAQRLRRVEQTGSDVRAAAGGGRPQRDGEVAGLSATVPDVHRTLAVLLYTRRYE